MRLKKAVLKIFRDLAGKFNTQNRWTEKGLREGGESLNFCSKGKSMIYPSEEDIKNWVS